MESCRDRTSGSLIAQTAPRPILLGFAGQCIASLLGQGIHYLISSFSYQPDVGFLCRVVTITSATTEGVSTSVGVLELAIIGVTLRCLLVPVHAEAPPVSQSPHIKSTCWGYKVQKRIFGNAGNTWTCKVPNMVASR